ncbi:tetratricopeptide repeat protein [Leptospira meyeri serovar Semaranga str. Veldrot Semarang 173]|nr:tetratricopeptide repeat protein [Leptospira meyeri]EMJ90078.1 tetratricopeptide repeat protein [Leptospira meyeri serovar Semaranga str. Veldrot Semarang 173]
MMDKTSTYTFEFVCILFLSTQMVWAGGSKKKEETTALRKQIYNLHKVDDETTSIPYLERYLDLSQNELYFKLLYAKALLYRNDLSVPRPDEPAEDRINKAKLIQKNYNLSSKLFQENVLHLEKVRPRDPNLGRWYYLWAFSEWFSDNKEKSIKLFQKAVKLDYRLTESYYNIASLYESLGQWQDASLYWRKFEKAEKELEEED